jgi:type II secretion system protein N
MHRRFLTTAAVSAAVVALFVVLTLLFVPDRVLRDAVKRELESAGFSFTAARFGKAFPLGIKAEGVTIANDRGEVLKADRAVARLALLPLLAGRINVTGSLRIGTGEVKGDFFLRGSGKSSIAARGIKLEDIPFFTTVTGAQVKGTATIKGSFSGASSAATGALQVEVTNADLRGVKIGETPLPDAGFDTVRGALKVGGGRITLESVTLQGEGLYVRLKGDLPLTASLSAAPLNLTLELMPKPEFLEKQKFVFLLLTKYQSSPGHYQVPIRGVLGKPAIQ